MPVFNIALIGDSHILELRQLKRKKEHLFKLIFIRGIPGKTAQGLNKHRNIVMYTKHLKTVKKKINAVGISLGEIDCACTIWTRKEAYKTTVEEELDYIIKGLQILIDRIKEDVGVQNIFFMAPILPLIKIYDKSVPDILKKRRDHNIPHEIIIKTTNRLIKKINSLCILNNCKLISVNDHLTNKDGTMKEHYHDNRNRFWHHLGKKDCIAFWSEKMNNLFEDWPKEEKINAIT